jgi:hypothetical protein
VNVMEDSDGTVHIWQSCGWTNYHSGMDLDGLIWCSQPAVGYGNDGRPMCEEHMDKELGDG